MNKSKQDCSDPMSDCYKAQGLLDKYIDNVLDSTEHNFINKHLKDCKDCCGGFAFESSFINRIHCLTPICMPQDFREKLMLSLGFPGISDPIKGSMAAIGADGSALEKLDKVSDNMGIPRGEIPRGSIPSHDFFGRDVDTDPSGKE